MIEKRGILNPEQRTALEMSTMGAAESGLAMKYHQSLFEHANYLKGRSERALTFLKLEIQ